MKKQSKSVELVQAMTTIWLGVMALLYIFNLTRKDILGQYQIIFPSNLALLNYALDLLFLVLFALFFVAILVKKKGFKKYLIIFLIFLEVRLIVNLLATFGSLDLVHNSALLPLGLPSTVLLVIIVPWLARFIAKEIKDE